LSGFPVSIRPFCASSKGGLEIPRAWDLFFEDLERHPPAMVVDTSAPGYFAFTRFPPSRYPRLQSFLVANYERTEVAGFPLWERKP